MWTAAEKYLSKDKYIGPLVKKHGPCKITIKHKDNYFIDLVDTIISQQLSGKVALVIFNRVKDKIIKVTPENILETEGQTLRDCGLSWAKVKYVKDLAERTKDGRLKTKVLNRLSDEEVREELIAVKGIGNWTVDMFLMFTLGRSDIFPVGDLGIRSGIKKLLKKDLTEEQMVKFAERWKPYRTVASWYIWQNLDNT